MKIYILCFVSLLVGIGAGIGIWYYVTAPQLAQQQTRIDELQTEAETAASESEQAIQKASTEIARLQKQVTLESSKTQAMNKMVIQARMELEALKRQIATQPKPAEAEPAQPEQKATAATTATTTTIKPSSPVSTRIYIVKDGDSLWKIAANELSGGYRLREIIDLNPGVTEKTVLQKGMKLNIPQK